MAEKSEEQVYREKAQQIKKTVLKDFKSFAQDYFNDAHDTGMTPTEDQAVKDVRERGQQIFEGNHDYNVLTAAQQKEVMADCEKEIAETIRAQYRTYIDRYHPAVNGQTPYHVDKAWKKEAEPYAKNINAHVEQALNDFLGECAKKGVCPNEKQINACIEGWITKYKGIYGPKFQMTEAQNLWLRKRLYDNIPHLMKTYHAYADTVKITNTYPSGYPGVSTSAPPDPRSPKPKLPDGVVPGKGGNPSAHEEPKKKEMPASPDPKDFAPLASIYTKTNVSFSGCDMVVSANMKTTDGHTVSVVMGSVQTVSYSIYRKLSPINNIGNVNAKDYVGGPRTVAGSLVFTVFHQHWATELMDKFMAAEGYTESRKILMDEVAPIDLTITMANEFGVESRLAIYGIRLFSEGQVMSINDIYTENTYQYVALNVDYLANIHTVKDVWSDWADRMNAKVAAGLQHTQVPGEQPVTRGDTSRVESKKPPTDEEKYGITTESPVYQQKAENNPVHQAHDEKKGQETKNDTKPKESKTEVRQRIGKEGAARQDAKSRVSTSDDVIEVFDGVSLSLKGRTQNDCLSYVDGKYASKIRQVDEQRKMGKITNEQCVKEKERLTAQRRIAKEKIVQHFNQEFGG